MMDKMRTTSEREPGLLWMNFEVIARRVVWKGTSNALKKSRFPHESGDMPSVLLGKVYMFSRGVRRFAVVC